MRLTAFGMRSEAGDLKLVFFLGHSRRGDGWKAFFSHGLKRICVDAFFAG